MDARELRQFNDSMDSLQYMDPCKREKVLAPMTDVEAGELAARLCPNSNVIVAFCDDPKRYGFTYPLFEDSPVTPSGHMVVICTPNRLVLTHELAHVLDLRINPRDIHDCIFMDHWSNLLKEV